MRKSRQNLFRGSVLHLVFAIILSFLSLSSAGQNALSIKGVVKDESGLPLPGVTVSAGATSLATNVEGEFTIRVSVGTEITFNSTGYDLLKVTVTNASPLTIVLKESNTSLQEVVVVGYGTQKKASVTGAVSTIRSEDLVRSPATSTSGALTGIQGVNLRSPTGRPGSTTNIQIRNMGAALFVIDGVPQSEGQFNQLGLEDIESISVLKDGSAAIYGFRASNGVVLVTTKKGKIGKNNINVNSYYGLQGVTRYMEPSDAYLFQLSQNYADQNSGNPLTISPAELEKWKQGTEPGYQSVNYKDVILGNKAPQSYINVNASGATEKMNYYLSLSNLHQDANLKDYYFKRTNLQANIEGSAIKGIKVGAQISGRIEQRHDVASSTGLGVSYDNPFLAILTMWPTERMYANDNPNYINGNLHNAARNPAIFNENVLGTGDNIWRNFGSIFYVTAQLPFGITAKASYSYNYKQNSNEISRKNYYTYRYQQATGIYQPTLVNLAARQKYRGEIQENFAQLQLNWNKTFGTHTVAALAAYEYQSITDQNINILSAPQTQLDIIQQPDITTFSNAFTPTKRASFISKLNYDYKSKYLVEVVGRYDGTALYNYNQRYGFFPGVTAGWRISEEAFIKNNFPVISNLKLRASWGRTGREQGVGAFDYLEGVNYPGGTYVFDPSKVTTGVSIRPPATTTITWVTATSKNIGLDVGLMDGKITGEFDVFWRDLTGLPAPRTDVLVPSEIGYTLPQANLNSERTQGIEGKITYNNRSGQVEYSISGNATLARRKTLNVYRQLYGNSIDEYRSRTANRWSDIYWGYEIEGQFQSMDQIKSWPIDNDNRGNTTVLPGDIILKDQNGDGVINREDERPIGYATGASPYLSFGFNTMVRYKNFDLLTDWNGGTMQSYYRALETQVPFQGTHNSPNYILGDVWHRANVFDPNSEWVPGKYPAIRRNGGTLRTYTALNSFWMKNVSYIRLKNLQVGYTFSQRVLAKTGISKARIYFTGSNLFSIDNVADIQLDPEIAFNSGLIYPNVKIYTLGINLTF